MPGHSTEIANEFLERAYQSGRALTQMQLQKLVYLAHGWMLAVTGNRLVNDQVQAWEYGPVYRDLYRALRPYGSRPVTRKIQYKDVDVYFPDDSRDVRGDLSDIETAVIDKVFETYGGFQAFKLSALTHEAGSPWSETYRPGVQSLPISDDLIKSHFEKLSGFSEETERG